MKQVVHNRDEIANILSDAANVGDDKEAGNKPDSASSHLHLEPVVELWCALAKDLQQDFAPYFDRFADAVVSDLTLKVPELIKAAFLALNEVLRILQRRGGPERALDMFSKVMESTLASPRMPPHSLALVAEAASNVVRRARDKEEFFERLLQGAERNERAAELCLEVALLSCSQNVMAKGKDGNVNERTWKTWLAVCFGKGGDSAVGLTAPLLEGMNRVFAASDALKCSEALLDKMQAASVACPACYSVAHSIMEMSSVRETPQFVLNFIEASVSKLDGEELPAEELAKSLRKALEMAKAEARESVVRIVDEFLSCEGYSSSEKTSVMTGLRSCGCFDSVCLPRLKAFWKKAAKKKKGEEEKALAADVARAVNTICEVWEEPDTWQAYVMELDADSVASVVNGALECRTAGELVEMLRSFVYLRPLERNTLLRVCQHVREVLANDDDDGDESSFSDCVHALVRSLVKLGGRGGGADILSELGDATLGRIGTKLAQRRPGGNLTEAVALLAKAGGAERAIPQLRPSLVRLLSSPDGGTRRNAIEALRVLTGAATFGAMRKADAVGFKGASMSAERMQAGHRERMAAVERLKGEEGEEEAVLRFFFGNLFVNFALLVKPTIALIEEFAAKLDADPPGHATLWEVVRDVYDSTGDSPQLRGLVLQCLEAISNTDEKACRFVVDDFLDNFVVAGRRRKKKEVAADAKEEESDIGQAGRRKLTQRYARVFSRLQNVRSAKRFPELRAAMATAAGDFDLATQKEGLNFFASAFKEVRSHKQLLSEVLEKDKWRDHLRALPEKLGSAERVTAKVTEVLSCLILGHLRRTVQEKGKRQQDQRRFILQSCSLIGTDFLLNFVEHVVREAAPQLAKEEASADKDGGGGGENLGMALDICVQTCPLLQSDDAPDSAAALGRLNDNCVDLLCLIGDKMCGSDSGVNSKARSRLLSVVQKAFKGFKGLTMNAEQMQRFVESCVAPALRRDDNSSSTQVSSKLVPLLDAWLGDNSR